ncbi:DUF418 domain-containing protein [Bacillus sp. CGMCC 1.16607]|uniref:DUF418 domain-containing protein n=1 Tax=Bacillus sp. CGMCC 1.16607 TaxID=3351842 RepID=UPI003627EFFE
MNSIDINKRISILDYLRGTALIGIILVNVLPLLLVTTPSPHTLDAAYQRFLFLFIEGRFYTIFSFLFGVGFYLFLSRAKEKGKNGTALFLRRILAMFLMGVVHFTFQPGEALTVYSVFGLFVLPFYKVKKEINLVIGIAFLVLFSLISAKLLLVFPLILLGLTAGQYRVFENLPNQKQKLIPMTVILFVLSGIALFYQWKNVPGNPFDFMNLGGMDDRNIEQSNTFKNIGIMVGPIVSAFYISLICLLLHWSFFQKILLPLRNYGRMALTNYVLQTAFILLAGQLFNLYGNISYVQSLYLCLSILVIQLIFSSLWLRFFQFGPLEWIWRMVTYLKIQPIRKEKS